ncbi:hypothetical protein ACQKNS_24545 [Peribacillus sp. NPDC094092]|uniref:hypothetical protein n=1 Tax=Peribacillus sp. NPDC094092 TaxID=3390611 RepID=UPI003CFC6A98
MQNRKALSLLIEWLKFIDYIDQDILKWVKLSAVYSKENYRSDVLIDHLTLHVKKTPKEVGEIMLEMLSADIYCDYQEEEIRQIVSSLYNENQGGIADKICVLYGEKGFEFLRDIYSENHKIGNFLNK